MLARLALLLPWSAVGVHRERGRRRSLYLDDERCMCARHPLILFVSASSRPSGCVVLCCASVSLIVMRDGKTSSALSGTDERGSPAGSSKCLCWRGEVTRGNWVYSVPGRYGFQYHGRLAARDIHQPIQRLAVPHRRLKRVEASGEISACSSHLVVARDVLGDIVALRDLNIDD